MKASKQQIEQLVLAVEYYDEKWAEDAASYDQGDERTNESRLEFIAAVEALAMADGNLAETHAFRMEYAKRS